MHHMIYPAIGTLTYLSYPKDIKISNNILFPISIFHNLFLAIFSCYVFVNLADLLYKDGIHYEAHYYLKNSESQIQLNNHNHNHNHNQKYDELIYYFYLSKYYEYADTFLLYLKNREPIFLQKFHHIGAVICWHLCYVYKVDAIVLGTLLNSGVHTIMYTYYLLTLFKIKLSFIKPVITSMQLVQLTVGNMFSAYYYYPPVESAINYSIILFTNAYIFVLIYLFSDFYKTNYLQKTKTK